MGTFIAIDPGTKAGATYCEDDRLISERWNVAAKTKTKSRAAEPKHYRLLHLWNRLESAYDRLQFDTIVSEGAHGFMRGKAAIEASHKYRAVIQLFAAIKGLRYVEIPPNDLKYFALGKRSGGKDEMIDAARELGYEGFEDNEADSFLIYRWYSSLRTR